MEVPEPVLVHVCGTHGSGFGGPVGRECQRRASPAADRRAATRAARGEGRGPRPAPFFTICEGVQPPAAKKSCWLGEKGDPPPLH